MGNEIPVVGTGPEAQFRFKVTMVAQLALRIGGFLFVVGWLDIVLGWYPSGLGDPEWEFGAVSSLVDAMPLSTVGLTIQMFGALFLSSVVGRWIVVAWSSAVFVLLTIGAILYWTTIPIAIANVPFEYAIPLKVAVAKTSGLLVGYIVLYLWFGLLTLRTLIKFAVKTGKPAEKS